ncbi:MAG: MATE family efflux transporter [Cypionkella sp.]|nr:MATE family efflux transporter [Cypionkella sp.]
MSLTNSVGLMAIFSVDLINMVYISWLGDPVKTAAAGYAGAVMFFTTSFAIGVAIAVSALVARAVGQGDLARARARATSGMVLGVGSGTVFAGLVWLFLPQIGALLGARDETLAQTVMFLRWYTLSQPLLLILIIGAAILRAHGDAQRSMMVTVWGAVALAAMDPVLILWADMGLKGAALAGGISRLAMAFFAVMPIMRHYGGFDRLRWADLRPDVRPLLGIAGPAILTQLATPVGQASVTRLVAGYGEAAVAGMAISGRLTPVAFGVIFAMSGAIGPIIGQNLGAGRIDRVRAAFRDSILFLAVVILVMSAVLFAVRAPIATLFHAEGMTRDLIYLFCGPLSLLFFFNGLIFIANATCNNLGAAYQSTLVNWGRHTLGTLPIALWLGGVWGPQGVLIGQALGGVIFGILGVWLAYRMILATPSRI